MKLEGEMGRTSGGGGGSRRKAKGTGGGQDDYRARLENWLAGMPEGARETWRKAFETQPGERRPTRVRIPWAGL